MKISLLHPSRSRPQKATDTYNKWIELAGCDVEHILSIDNNDALKMDYFKLHKAYPAMDPLGSYSRLFCNDNNSVVEATNKAAKESTGDILIYLSDDFKCPDNWGELIIKEFQNENRPLLVKVDDMLQPFATKVLTIPIMNRALYDKLGYFWHPDYKSMFVDEDLYWTSSMIGALKFAPHLRFPHEHCSIGKCEVDDTYRRSEANWNQGQATFNRRKALKFPL